MVIFLEECVVLHSSLLKLHINAAAIYRNHLFDSAKTSFNYNRLAKGEVTSTEVPSTLKQFQNIAHFTLLKRVDSFIIAVRE